MGPDVMSPVVGSIGMGPEFPDWGPEDFFNGSPCLDKGPEFVFFIEFEPVEAKEPDMRPVALGPPGPGCWPLLEEAPVIGPDFLDLVPSVGMSNIFPSSPDFLMSPPV